MVMLLLTGFRLRIASKLLGQSVIIRRKNALIQGFTNFSNPGVMEIVKDACLNPRPIMNRHGFLLSVSLDTQQCPLLIEIILSGSAATHKKLYPCDTSYRP